jgi:DNA (cytosine-5)-methyltransferase 1
MTTVLPDDSATEIIRIAGRKPNVVDLFCGAGGLTRGLIDCGLHVTSGYDLDEYCKFAYEANNFPAKFVAESITDLTSEKLNAHYNSTDWKILVGCAPCQPFSTYTQGKTSEEDRRWSLLSEFARLIGEVQPDIVSMENVPGLQNHSVFIDFVDTLQKYDYKVSYQIVFCPDYGIPQQRKRLVLLASRHGSIDLISPTHTQDKYVTVKETIGHLPKIKAGEKNDKDALHTSPRLDKLNTKRIQQSKPGGSWRDWPEDLVADCHKQESGSTYASVYGRMEWDKPSPTITTQFYGFGNGRFGHPDQDRAISIREGALIQTFPKDYEFLAKESPLNVRRLGKLIGNAVPVRLGEVIGLSIIKHLEEMNV